MNSKENRAKKIIPIVFATDDNYFPYMAVSIQSIIENADLSHNYNIYVLCQTLLEDYKQLLQKQVEPYQNFSVKYVDVSTYFKDYATINVPKYTINTLFRLLIPDIFTEYKFVIWIDVDTICLTNIADFWYNTDENCLLKCVKDIGTQTLLLRDYPQKIGLRKYQNYFSAGVLVFNIELLKKCVTFEEMMELYLQKRFPYNDQDLLNLFCEDKVQYASMDWNVICGKCQAYKNPKIIHYVWDKPWKSFYKTKRGKYFWEYAKKTPFYDIILEKSKKKHLKDIVPLLKFNVITLFAKFLTKEKTLE